MIYKEIEYSDIDEDIVKIKIGSRKRESIYRSYLATKTRLNRISGALLAMKDSGFSYEVHYPYKTLTILLSK